MKRVLLPLVITASLTAIVLLLLCQPRQEVETVVIHPQPTEKTILAPGKLSDRTHVQLFLRESLADTVKIGQPATVSGAGLRKAAYPGTVVAIAEEATVENGKTGLAAEVFLDDTQTDDSLKPGLTTAVRLSVQSFQNVIVIDEEWLLPEEEVSAVFVLEEEQAVKRHVTIIEQTDNGLLVEGLCENEHVLVNPSAVRNPQKVREKQP